MRKLTKEETEYLKAEWLQNDTGSACDFCGKDLRSIKTLYFDSGCIVCPTCANELKWALKLPTALQTLIDD